jgi:hypothetical protein
MPDVTPKLTANCTKVLAKLCSGGEDWCFPFAPIMRDTGLDRATVRRACRLLKRKGMAEFHRGLWTEDGNLAGAGYSASPAGRLALEQEGRPS